MNTCKTSPFGIKLTESSDALRLGTDALLLSAYIKEQSNATALEIGAGSGVISLMLAKRGAFKKIHALEVQDGLFSLLCDNIKENGLEHTINPLIGDIRFLNPESVKGVSAVFTNPPYMKTDSGKSSPSESRQISRHEVNGGIADFCKASSKILKTGGRLYIVYRPDRLSTMIKALSDNGFSPKRMTFVHASEGHAPSSVLCEAVLGGGEQLKVTRPLLLNSADGDYIYQNGVFPEDFYKI